MKKILLLSTLLFIISVKTFAQTSEDKHLSIGINTGLPVGNESNFLSVLLGADLKYTQIVASNLSVSISAGYTEMIGKNFTYNYDNGVNQITVSGRASNSGAIPVKAGVRYFVDAKGGFFAEAQAGATFSGGGGAFVYAPAVGYVFGSGYEIGVRYEGWTKNNTVGQVALRLALNFSFEPNSAGMASLKAFLEMPLL